MLSFVVMLSASSSDRAELRALAERFATPRAELRALAERFATPAVSNTTAARSSVTEVIFVDSHASERRALAKKCEELSQRNAQEQAARKKADQETSRLKQQVNVLQNDVLAAVAAGQFHSEDDQIWAVKVQNLKRRIEEEQVRREASEQRVLEMRSEIERLRGLEAEQQERAELRQYFVDPVFTLVNFTPDIQGAITSLAPGGLIAGDDPKRISLDFTDQEYGVAVAIAQMCPLTSRDAYLTALTLVFSPKRANALLEKMTR